MKFPQCGYKIFNYYKMIKRVLSFHKYQSLCDFWSFVSHLSKQHVTTTYFLNDCLFEMMLYVPVNSNGRVGTLPPFYGKSILWEMPPLGCHDTQNLHQKCNNQSKPVRIICMDDLTKPLFLGRLRRAVNQ